MKICAHCSIEHHGDDVHGVTENETVERLSPVGNISLREQESQQVRLGREEEEPRAGYAHHVSPTAIIDAAASQP